MNSDPQEMVRRFNDEEAIYRRYQEQRTQRRRRFRLRPRLAEKLVDQLDWLATGREMRPVCRVGRWIDR